MKRTPPSAASPRICPNPRPRRGRSSNCAPIWSSRRRGLRACSAWLAIDQIQLERAGVPTLTILTQPFLKTFHNVRQNLRIGPLHCITVPHPVAIIRDEKVRAKVDEAFPAILDALRSGKRADSTKTFPAETAPPGGSRSIVRRTGEADSGRPSVTGTAEPAWIAGSRTNIPVRRQCRLLASEGRSRNAASPHCRKKAVQDGAGQREISPFRPVPCGRPIHSKPIRDRRRSPIQKRTLRHCAERPFSTWASGSRDSAGLFPYPAALFHPSGEARKGPG